MTHLQNHVGDSRRQKLRSSTFWPTPLFRSQLVKDGEELLLKKSTLKILRVLDPIKTNPFVVPTIRKEAPTGNVGDNPLQAVSNRFLQVRGNRITDVTEAVFNLTQEDEGLETPPPNDSSKASLSPPVGGNCLSSFRSDWQTNKCSNNVLKIITNGYILPIHFKAKVSQSSPDSLRIKGPAKSSGSGRLYPLSSVKNTIERVENVKSLGFYSRLFFLSPSLTKGWGQWQTSAGSTPS